MLNVVEKTALKMLNVVDKERASQGQPGIEHCLASTGLSAVELTHK